MTIYVISGVLISLAIWVAIVQLKKHQAKQSRRNSALSSVAKIHQLISHLQKHRGLTALYIQGENRDRNALVNERDIIQHFCTQLRCQPTLCAQPLWLSFLDHWRRLQHAAERLSVSESFNQHTHLISNLLLLMEDCAESSGLTRWDLPEVPYIAMLWREFPTTVEYIGQARAVGLSITSAGTCDQVNRVRIGYLHKRIEQLTDSVFTQFEKRPDTSSAAREQIAQARQHCQSLCDVISNELLVDGKVQVRPETYFTLASCAMDSANKVMKLEFEHIEHTLHANVAA